MVSPWDGLFALPCAVGFGASFTMDADAWLRGRLGLDGDGNKQIRALRLKLGQALIENARLREENLSLRARLATLSQEPEIPLPQKREAEEPQAVYGLERQIAIMRGLFRGREDVFAVRWESRDGRSGYSPACANEWVSGVCRKPRVKCAQCESRSLLPVTDQVLADHLLGKRTIGVYPMLTDDRCWFLAIDFDKKDWMQDVGTVLHVAELAGIPAYVERSRSGNGAHLWVFFEEPVAASLARALGSALLARAMESRHQIGFDSYDRLFPNQDKMPKGGFGNLIALPMQGGPSKKGNSVFLDGKMEPYADQWGYLASVKKVKAEEVRALLGKIRVAKGVSAEEGLPLGISVQGEMPDRVGVIQSDMLYVEKAVLPSGALGKLLGMAAFQNPEFYKAQALRLPTYNIPRTISCSEETQDHIVLPRGCLDAVLEFFGDNRVAVHLSDQRVGGRQIDARFVGELRPQQVDAVREVADHDIGLLSAGTGFGKTVVASYLISRRSVNTLVLVHRVHLMEQWKEMLLSLLDVGPESIGTIGGGKQKPSGIIDIALLQSVNRKGKVLDLVRDYGHVVVDECHHISAFSFEAVMKKVRAKYVLGLTATPTRKDGHHPIVTMQCGPIRYRTNPRTQAKRAPFAHVVVERHTGFVPKGLLASQTTPSIHGIYGEMATDEKRNAMIVADVLGALQEGRSPLVITERRDHLEILRESLSRSVKNLIVFQGGMGVRQRALATSQLVGVPEGEGRVVLATGRYIGEGFDDARLDTLMLCMPVSWKGTLQQYAGRLHRLYEGKREVRIYDYVDSQVPMLAGMHAKRLKGYRALGYVTREDGAQDG